jgi:poly(3-hydroxybutyrate) depolymerase
LASCGEELITDPDSNEEIGTVRYNSLVFSAVDVTRNIEYGSSVTQAGATKQLTMDIYQPKDDTESNRPMIILAHGGGFQGGSKEDMQELATYFAQSGYVAASINYRLLDAAHSSDAMKRAVIDAVFDMKAAVRFMVKDAETNNEYKINKNKIFVGGYSAGAFMSLHYAYMTSIDDLSLFESNGLTDYVNANGGMSGNSGNDGYSDAIKGVINIAGALIKAEMVDANEPVLYSVHGTADDVVPYLQGDSDGSGVITEGSGLIHPLADQVGLTNQLKAIDGGDHGVFFECDECQRGARQFVFDNL